MKKKEKNKYHDGSNSTMKNLKLFVLLLMSSALLLSCAASPSRSTTMMTDTWKDKEYQGKPQKIIVIMAARFPDTRSLFEDRFVGELNSRGNNTFQSHRSIPFDQLRDKELVKSKIKSSGADTVLIARLVDTKTIESYRSGQITVIPFVVPDYYYGWWGYYNVVFADYGYTGDVSVAYIETNLYDVKTEKLIWSGHSKTERSYGEQELMTAFIQRIIKKLSSAGLIK
jgi:hypothetical protein